MAFKKAFVAYKCEPAWLAVAVYLYGNDWRSALNITDPATVPAAETSATDGDGNAALHEEDDLRHTRSVHDYVANLPIPEEEDEVAQDALEFLKKFVCCDGNDGGGALDDSRDEEEEDEDQEGLIIETEVEAKQVVNQLHSSVKKCILKYLVSNISRPAYQKANLSNKDLVSWLQKPNSQRTYLFYKSNGLKDLISARSIDLPQGQKTISHMVAALARPWQHLATNNDASNGTQDALQAAKDDATRAILEKSFLPHQKGKAREHCSLGHRLETPILKKWVEVASDSHVLHPPLPGLKSVEAAFTAGLAAKKGALYAKDSIDFVLAVRDDDDELLAWGFEAKGRVTASSAADEERNLRLMVDPHVRINDDEVHEVVANQGERFQVLQHAFVYDFPTVVLAISDSQSDLIRSTTIDFSTELKESFGKVLKDLISFSLYWAYPSTTEDNTAAAGGNNNIRSNRRRQPPAVLTVPHHILHLAESIPTINGADTLQGTANVWYSLSRLPKPFPSLVRLIPTIYAFWNAVKGGSDTTTKLMDDCLLRIPKVYLNTETVAVNRLISLLFVLFHRLSQINTSQDQLDTYPSLSHYRKAASERTTFHVSLLKCKDIFKQELETMSNNNSTHTSGMSNEPSAPVRRQQQTRRNPTRTRIDGVLPEPINFGPRLATMTPKKINRLAQAGNAPIEIQQMVQACTGMPMKSHPLKQMRCSICQSKTTYYCVGCKRWFCMERKGVRDNNKELNLYSHNLKGKQVTFQKLCFHKAHESAWTALGLHDNQNNGVTTEDTLVTP